MITARTSTSQKSAIFSFISCGMKRSQRHSRMSGWIPRARSSFTLCCVGLVFSSCAAAIHGTSVTWTNRAVVAALFVAHLADGFEERQRFDIADGAADLGDHHVHIRRHLLQRGLDFVGDVRNHLHGFAQVIAAPFARDDLLVDAAAGQVVALRQPRVGEAFVVAQVEIGLGAVVGDEDFAMLERAHRARIHIQVGIELLARDLRVHGFPAGSRSTRPAIPFPNEETTPPVTNMYLAISHPL